MMFAPDTVSRPSEEVDAPPPPRAGVTTPLMVSSRFRGRGLAASREGESASRSADQKQYNDSDYV